MITHVVMPKFTENMIEATILSWKLDEGEAVVSGDVLAKIETDTAVMELEAVGSGFLRHVLTSEGATVKAGTALAIIGDLDDDIGTALRESIKLKKEERNNSRKAKTSTPPLSKPKASKDASATTRDAVDNTASASPSESQIHEPADVPSSNDRHTSKAKIESNEIEQEQQRSIPEDTATKESDGLHVKRTEPYSPDGGTTPHFNLTTEIHMADAERLREQMIEIQRITLSLTTLYVRAAVLALSRNMNFQMACLGNTKGIIDVGITLMTEDSISAPILHNCSRKNIAELSEAIQEITQQTGANHCPVNETPDSRFTICNFGMYPIEQFIPILSTSQKATLALGAIRSVRIHESGTHRVDRRMTVTLSCDDQSLEEDQAGLFLQTFKQILERPLEIFLPNPVE